MLFFLRVGTRQGCCLFPFQFNIILQNLVNARQEMKTKGIQIGKDEIQLSLFTDGMTIYVEDPKELTKLELI